MELSRTPISRRDSWTSLSTQLFFGAERERGGDDSECVQFVHASHMVPLITELQLYGSYGTRSVIYRAGSFLPLICGYFLQRRPINSTPRRHSMTLEGVHRHEKLAPESGVEFMAPISGADLWSVCHGPNSCYWDHVSWRSAIASLRYFYLVTAAQVMNLI